MKLPSPTRFMKPMLMPCSGHVNSYHPVIHTKITGLSIGLGVFLSLGLVLLRCIPKFFKLGEVFLSLGVFLSRNQKKVFYSTKNKQRQITQEQGMNANEELIASQTTDIRLLCPEC